MGDRICLWGSINDPRQIVFRNSGVGAGDIGSSIGKESKTGTNTLDNFVSLKLRGETVTRMTTIHHVVRPPSLKLKAIIDIVNEFRYGSTEIAPEQRCSNLRSWTYFEMAKQRLNA